MHLYQLRKKLDTAPSVDDVYNFTDDELKAAETEADSLEWHDIIDLYDDDDLDMSHLTDQDWEPQTGEEDHHPDNLCEDLSAQQRNQKRLAFARTKQRRRLAMKISLHRQSNPGRLKNRSKAMAKRILIKKILHGRSKSQLSPQEKSRLERQLANASPAIARIAARVMPKIRQIEQTRLHHKPKKHHHKKKHVHEALRELPPEAFNNAEGPITIPSLEVIADVKKKAQLLYRVQAQMKMRK